MPDETPPTSVNRELAGKITAAYVRRNQIASDQLGTLISTVHQGFSGVGKPAAAATGARTPAVPIRWSRPATPNANPVWRNRLALVAVAGHPAKNLGRSNPNSRQHRN